MKWPNAASDGIRSQTILVIASIGVARMAPGTPHIQYQKIKAITISTGLIVKRRARSRG